MKKKSSKNITHWNNRLVQYEDFVGIHECYYYEDGTIQGVTQDWVLAAYDKDDMILRLEQLLKDVKTLPIIAFKDLPERE